MQVEISKFLRAPANTLMEASMDKTHIRLTRHGRMTHVVLPVEGMDPGDTVRFYWMHQGDALRSQRTFVYDPSPDGGDGMFDGLRLPGDDCGASPSTFRLWVSRLGSGSGDSVRLYDAKRAVERDNATGQNCGCNFSVIEQQHMEYPEEGSPDQFEPRAGRTWFCTSCHRRYTDEQWQVKIAEQNERLEAGIEAQIKARTAQKNKKV